MAQYHKFHCLLVLVADDVVDESFHQYCCWSFVSAIIVNYGPANLVPMERSMISLSIA